MPYRGLHVLEFKLTEKMITEAKQFKTERDKRKRDEGLEYDKFTTPSDAFIGRLGELVFEKYLVEMRNLKKDVDFEDNRNEEFYDRFDYRFLQSGKTVDVKAGQTKLEPDDSWTFGYPVAENPEKKTYVVLIYINPTRMKAMLVGFLTGSQVASYPKSFVNKKAGHEYKTLNYETNVGDYEEISKLDI
jgi:hypothetical protein